MLGADPSADVPPPVLVLDIVTGGNTVATAHIILDWDPQEGMVDHWFELRPSVSFQRHEDHSRTVDNRDERRSCEHGALHLQMLLLYNAATGSPVVDVSAPIVTQVCERLFKSKARERAIVDRLSNVFSEEFANSKLVGFLQVKVCRARQLPPIASDPRVYCASEMEGQLYLTATVTSMTPEWNHGICFGITDISSVLHVRVLQRHSGNHDHDELYGVVDIVPLDFVGDPHTASAFRRWYSISNRDIDNNSGQIELKFYYAPKQQDSLIVTDDFEDTASLIAMRRCTKVLHELSQRSLQMEDSSKTLEYLVDGLRAHRGEADSQMEAERMAQEPIGSLRLAIIKGRDMPKMDEFGAADPYCIVRFAQSPQERTLTCPQTLEPNWEQSDGSNEFVFDVYTLDSKVNIQIWDEDEADADDFMDELEVAIKELPPGHITEEWFSCREYNGHTDAQLYIQMGLSMGSQRDDNHRRLEDMERERIEMDRAPVQFRCCRAQAEKLLNRTKSMEETLRLQRDAAASETQDVKRQLAEQLKSYNNMQQKLSMKRVTAAKKLQEEQQKQEALEKAVDKWNEQGEDADEDGFCEQYCECCMIPNDLVPTLVKFCYGVYFICGVVTLLLGLLVHNKIGYIVSVFTIGVAGTGICMVIIGALVLLFASLLEKKWGWHIVLTLNVIQLVMLGFVACDAGLQFLGVSNHVLPLVRDWWGAGNGHPSHTLGQNLQCILAIQDSSAAPLVGTAQEAFELVITGKCGASIQHRMDMFTPKSRTSTFGFQCRDWARASCSEWESEFFKAATASCSDTQYSTESECSANDEQWTDVSVQYVDAKGDDAVRSIQPQIASFAAATFFSRQPSRSDQQTNLYTCVCGTRRKYLTLMAGHVCLHRLAALWMRKRAAYTRVRPLGMSAGARTGPQPLVPRAQQLMKRGLCLSQPKHSNTEWSMHSKPCRPTATCWLPLISRNTAHSAHTAACSRGRLSCRQALQ